MPLKSLKEKGIDDANVESIRGEMEVWSSEDTVRFGNNVRSGVCVELKREELDRFSEVIDDTQRAAFKSTFNKTTYLFEKNSASVHIYHEKEHVATVSNSGFKNTISRAKQNIKDSRLDQSPVERAKAIVVRRAHDESDVRVYNHDGKSAGIAVISDYFRPTEAVSLCRIPQIRNSTHPVDYNFETEDDFVRGVEKFLKNVSIKVRSDGSIKYILIINGETVPEQPEEYVY